MLKELREELNKLQAENANGKERYIILFGNAFARKVAATFISVDEESSFLFNLQEAGRYQFMGHQAVYISRLPTFTVLKVSELSAIMMASLVA